IGRDSITKTVNVIATSVEEKTSGIANMTLFPNPTDNEVNLLFNTTAQTSLVVTVIDLTGKILKHVENAQFLAGNHVISFNTTELASGMYFVRMETENGIKTMRLVVAK
ncbi:MAG: T9SS type A sorting domain-containing protein, partial [Bacteroidota bacterium]